MPDDFFESSMIPTQVEADADAELYSNIGDSTAKAIIGVSLGSLSISLVSNMSLSYVWAMIDGL